MDTIQVMPGVQLQAAKTTALARPPGWRERLAGMLVKGATAEMAAAQPMTLTQWVDLLGGDNRPGKLWQQSTYYICLKRLAEGIGKMPLRVMQRMPDGGVREAMEHPLYRLLRYRPNRFVDAPSFWAAVETQRAHCGNAYIWRQETREHGTQLWLLPSDSVEVWLDDGKRLADRAYLWYVWTAENGQRYALSHEEIIHLRWGVTTDGIMGIPVSQALLDTVRGNQRAQSMLNKLYENGMTGKAVVQYTGNLSDVNVQSFLSNMQHYAAGEVRDGQTFIPVPVGATLTPLNVKLTDSQFLELKRYSASEIAAAFGISPAQLNDYEKSSYASASAQQLDFYMNTLMYISEHYEAALNHVLLSDRDTAAGYYVDFDEQATLRADPEKQIEQLRSAVGNALMTPNEARAELGRPAKEGGDELYANGNIIPLRMAGQQFAKENPATEDGAENQER